MPSPDIAPLLLIAGYYAGIYVHSCRLLRCDARALGHLTRAGGEVLNVCHVAVHRRR